MEAEVDVWRRVAQVLVDTAGRMQGNEPLMRALSKLINMNKPDLARGREGGGSVCITLFVAWRRERLQAFADRLCLSARRWWATTQWTN